MHQQIRRKLTLLIGFSSETFGGFTALVVARLFRVGFEWLDVAGGAFDVCLRGAGVARDLPHCKAYEHRVSETSTNARTPRWSWGACGFPCAADSEATHRVRTMGTLACLAFVRRCFLGLGSGRGRDWLQLDLLVAGSGGRRRRRARRIHTLRLRRSGHSAVRLPLGCLGCLGRLRFAELGI